MIDGNIKKGLLLEYKSDNHGALNDPCSLQKMSFGWNTGIDISKDAWGSSSAGNGGGCIHLPCDKIYVQLWQVWQQSQLHFEERENPQMR